MNTLAGLTEQDLKALSFYAYMGNRELYWNYLAQLAGNDGYGRLALGVVRNDNVPGATANAYAQNYARKHDGITLTEREWDDFGVDLINNDLALRRLQVARGDHANALNLPGADIRKEHEQAFKKRSIDPNAWTPYKPMMAARAQARENAQRASATAVARGEVPDTRAAEDAAEHAIWTSMLNNDAMGLERGFDTLATIATSSTMSAAERATYLKDVAVAYGSSLDKRSSISPDIIGDTNHYFIREESGQWVEVEHSQPTIGIQYEQVDPVSPVKQRELEDIRDLRLQREAARDDFHPRDPGHLIPSPHPIAEARPRSTLPGPDDDPVYAEVRHRLPMEITDEKAAELAMHARRIGIHAPDDIRSVDVDGDEVVCHSMRSREFVCLEKDAPSPTKDESVARGQQWDWNALEYDRQMAEMQQAQQLAMQQQQPVRSMSV